MSIKPTYRIYIIVVMHLHKRMHVAFSVN